MESKTRDPDSITNVVSVIPKRKQDLLKWNGWGYKDTSYEVIDGKIVIVGDKYDLGSNKTQMFPLLVKRMFGLDLNNKKAVVPMPVNFPDIVECFEFLQNLTNLKIDFTTEGPDRIYRSHGQSIEDIYEMREGLFKRIPDLVIWPTSHNQVVQIVEMANKYNVVLIPFGGGTNVSRSVTCPEHEKRPIASVDTSQMNRMLWVDKEGLIACFESGIVGQDLERVLKEKGLTLGHEPDSHEFSTLGGWVATRASGMKKNEYGNIEDIVVNIKMVTSSGVLGKNFMAPRVSCGPDLDHLILGSEGTLGLITEVTVKVRPYPKVKKYASVMFGNFQIGFECFREIAKNRIQPASMRLLDNIVSTVSIQVDLTNGLWSSFVGRLKYHVMTTVFGLDINEVVGCTILFEGTKAQIADQELRVNKIVSKYGGIHTGEAHGRKGYVLTFVVVYVRDFMMDYGGVSDSFETSCIWDKALPLIQNVLDVAKLYYEKFGVQYYGTTYRISQVYDEGVCIYFYSGYNPNSREDCLRIFHVMEKTFREVIKKSGGTISHHHGIGRLKSDWYKGMVSDVGVQLYKAAKKELDPKNIFGCENLLPSADHKERMDNLNAKL